MSDEPPGPHPKDFDARLRAARAKRAEREGEDRSRVQHSGLGFAFRIGSELVAGIAVGVAIGLGLDWWLGTKPWFMIGFFFLGAAAGMLNVYRTVSGIGHGVGYTKDFEEKRPDAERSGTSGKGGTA